MDWWIDKWALIKYMIEQSMDDGLTVTCVSCKHYLLLHLSIVMIIGIILVIIFKKTTLSYLIANILIISMCPNVSYCK